MLDLSTNDILNLTFHTREEPILAPFGGAVVVADPSLLTPDQAPDGKWHMFLHTTFGVYHFRSPDGIAFEKVQKVACRAMRPNINKVGDRYYLFYEETRPLLANALNLFNLTKWKSHVSVLTSLDLIHWSKPRVVVDAAGGYEQSARGSAISNPFLLATEGKYRLYFSCGLTFIDDCGFCEPTHIQYAESDRIDQGYVVADKPIISPDKSVPYLNLCSGCLKVYRVKDGYVGIQNGIYEEDGASHSAIIMLTSQDGLRFDYAKMLITPKADDPKSWMHQFVYASHLVRYGNVLRLYFNARNTADMLRGRECIGFAEAILPQ
jgi:hypothetical protein